MTFDDCVYECADLPGFVEQFNLLTGLKITAAQIIDAKRAAAGTEEAELFERFVFDCVWTHLDHSAFAQPLFAVSYIEHQV